MERDGDEEDEHVNQIIPNLTKKPNQRKCYLFQSSEQGKTSSRNHHHHQTLVFQHLGILRSHVFQARRCVFRELKTTLFIKNKWGIYRGKSRHFWGEIRWIQKFEFQNFECLRSHFRLVQFCRRLLMAALFTDPFARFAGCRSKRRRWCCLKKHELGQK